MQHMLLISVIHLKTEQKGAVIKKRVLYLKLLQTLKIRKQLNTRGERCEKDNMTVCCPHMTPDEKGRYAATTKKKDPKLNELVYRNKVYSILTCCPMCAEQMNSLSIENPDEFDEIYKVKIKNNGKTMLLANRHTGEYVHKSQFIRNN
jgi:hypothetical protein